ncbi:undecaprenyl-diphosphate phosphatase [Xenorhabdus sp. 12]|uniref:undecaprenyl-diphosphate phosphatase n=1 Tax=Xenorhabdus santafensis TaxID=2582833 RepID=A0ABU4S9T7_9GAMM|nr:undecaprenyl-diphosphate phosphatase [Xenorhabdus sp. 12]MDX7987568.1 undecaprenyl-diphosphate phosphatase [Xenorhabdus sp. 12]
MLEQLNHNLFTFINATPDSSPAMILIAILIAKYCVFIYPATLAICWLWGKEKNIALQRIVVSKSCIAFALGITASYIIGILVPHARPFVEGFGYNYLLHAPTESFPSNHGTAVFTFSLAFLFWHRIWSGLCLLVIACAIAWSRVYVGVHWPLDMVGAFLISLLSCALTQMFWNVCGQQLQNKLIRIYQFICSFFIQKGWVKN